MMDEISKGTTQARIDSLFHFDRKFARVGSKRLASAIQLHTAPATPFVNGAMRVAKAAKRKGAKAKASAAASAAAAGGAQPVGADDGEATANDGTTQQPPASRKRLRKAAQTTTRQPSAGGGRKRRATHRWSADASLELKGQGEREENEDDGELCD